MKLLVLLSLLFSKCVLAKTRIAFFKTYSQGKLIQFSAEGQYTHVAIEFNEKWIHADPYYGVVVIDHLSEVSIKEYQVDLLEHPEDLIPTNLIEKYIGLPYDHNFTWSDDAIYCSELIAKLLGLKPRPMKFNTEIWNNDYTSKRGLPGLSPDDLFSNLMEKGFSIKSKSCFNKMKTFSEVR